MAENDVKTPGVVKEAGTPVAGKPAFAAAAEARATAAASGGQSQQQQDGTGAAAASTTPTEGAATGAAAAATGAPNEGAAGTSDQPDFEKIKATLKSLGIEGFETTEDLKTLVKKANTPTPAEPTPEEKAAAEQVLDKRMLDKWTAGGGKVEDYVALKQIATADLKALSNAELKRELKNAGFDDNEIAVVIAERYYQQNPDELQKEPGEEDADFEKRKALLKKKATYGSQTLENRGLPIRKEAEGRLQRLRDEIKLEDLLKEKETEFASKVDAEVSKFPQEIKLDLGELDNQAIEPVTFKIPQSILTEIAAELKDPQKRQQLFFNSDNSTNLPTLIELMAVKKYLNAAIKATYLEGGDRQVKVFEKTFGKRTPHELGVSGTDGQSNQGGRKGVIAGAGEPQRVVRQQQR